MNSPGINSNYSNSGAGNAMPSSTKKDEDGKTNQANGNPRLISLSNFKTGRKRIFFNLLIGYK